jgi:hypothetical protein
MNSRKKSSKRKIKDLTSDDQKSIQETATANVMIIIWRPINPDAKTKLSQPGIMGKGLNIKAKSSVFEPIAGDIPYDVRLSKIWNSDDDNVKHAQGKIDKQIKSDNDTHQHIFSEEKKDPLLFDINKYNDQLLVTKIEKTILVNNKNEFVYCFCDGNNQIIRQPGIDGNPWFAVKVDGNQYKIFNNVTKKFDLSWETVKEQNNWQAKPVEILGYRQCCLAINNELEMKICPITADYDELVSATAKFYPFDNNTDITIKFDFDRDFYISLVEAKENKGKSLSFEEITAKFILLYEQAIKEENRQVKQDQQQPFMGLVNDWQHVFKTVLKIDTNAHTNHGPEVNNPFPEIFSEKGEYPIFYPSKTPETKSMSEKDVCNFINEHRKNGFPLDVNPRWGWEVKQETGELSVPEQGSKFDWKKVDEDIAHIGQEMVSLDKDRESLLSKYELENTDLIANILIKVISGDQYTSPLSLVSASNKGHLNSVIDKLQFIRDKKSQNNESKEQLEDLGKIQNLYKQFPKIQQDLETHVSRYHDEVQVRDLKLNIERLKLEPELVYYQGELLPSDQPKRVIFKPEEKVFRAKVIELVCEKEHRERREKIYELEKKLHEEFKKYKNQYDGQKCLTEQEMEKLSQKKKLNQEIDEKSAQINIHSFP